MKSRPCPFRRVRLSLAELASRDYTDAVCEARARLTGERIAALRAIASEKVDFYPPAYQRRVGALLGDVDVAGSPFSSSSVGAATRKYAESSSARLAPLTGLGMFRIGEDGRLHLILKSEHYHASVGHSFPGFRLLDHARRLGIPNATHNNTRGHLTRLLEVELIRTANGLARGDDASLGRTLAATAPDVINRVLNIQTGSLAMEAAIKIVLSRFHRVQADSPKPEYAGRIPVVVVIGNDQGGLQGNYHGTTLVAQAMRSMWPEWLAAAAAGGLMVVRAVRPNNGADMDAVFCQYDRGRYKVAAVIHELVMMNYGGRRLTESFIRRAYALCRKHDALTVVDEIQSCVWSPELYMYREYGIRPHIVAVGKGLSGGESASSRLLVSSAYDRLPQFGALVTNGQEEISSLAYLVTMRWAEENAAVTRAVGDYYEERMRSLAQRYRGQIRAVEGKRHLLGIQLCDLDVARRFAATLSELGLDISVQTYKADCPPSALTKLPLIADRPVVDFIVDRMERTLQSMSATAFTNPKPNPRLPRVLLIGDSISIGYTMPVREYLQGKANVYRPPENCQDSGHVLASVRQWLGTGKWDVIHFNCGIWDTHYLDLKTGALVLDEGKMVRRKVRIRNDLGPYRENLAKLAAVLQATGAQLIWASSTPVMFRKGARFQDIVKYNAVAASVMKRHGIEIDDLYAFTFPAATKWQDPDQCHFNPLGNKHLGDKVGESILGALRRRSTPGRWSLRRNAAHAPLLRNRLL